MKAFLPLPEPNRVDVGVADHVQGCHNVFLSN
jgi:hypothetical protein